MYKRVSCLLVNIRSLRQNLNEFICALESTDVKPEILIFTEIWIYTHEVGLYSIHGYNSYFACQNRGVAGGVGVYVRDDLTSCAVATYMRNVEACVVDVLVGSQWLRVRGIYRSPNRAFSDIDEFLASDLVNVLQLGSTAPLDDLLVGDLNIDISKPGLKTDDYLNILAGQGYEWLETGVTRVGKLNERGTIVDHAFLKFTNVIEATGSFLNLENELDHKTIKLDLTFQSITEKNCRNTNRTHWSQFNSLIDKQDLTTYYADQDPISACRALYTIISRCKDQATRLRNSSKQKNRPLKPWITPHILRCIKIRNNLKRLCDKYPDIVTLSQKYKQYRNKLKEIIRQAEDAYINKSVGCTKNPREAWQVLNNDIRGRHRKKIMPTVLRENNETGREALNKCNLYFAEIGKKLAESNGAISYDEICMYATNTKLSQFAAPDASKIKVIIDHLENGKAPGWDGLRAETLKQNACFYAKMLEHLVKLIFTSGQYPDELKKAAVVLIHKAGSPEDVSNYRPISLLSVLNKIVEEILVVQLKEHLERNSLLVEHQYGFRTGRGTQQAICSLQTCIQETLENNEHSLVVFLDYSRAFDTIPRKRLLAKLASMGVEDKALELISSYLHQRTQCIKVDHGTSDEIAVDYGVPQGGTIAPILFTVYINDLLYSREPYEHRIGYADDTCIVFRFKNEVCRKSIEKTLQQVQKWSSVNGLVLNHKKSKYITFGNQLRRFRDAIRVHDHELSTNEAECSCPQIENVTEINYLGVVIDERLTWTPHVEKLKPKLRAALACISKIRKSLSLGTIKMIYRALFESHLRYGLLAYGAAFPSVLMPLETLQNVCLRSMLRAHPMESAETLYTRANTLPLKKIYLEAILLNFSIRESSLGAQLADRYKKRHGYQTRAVISDKITLPKYRLERTQRTYRNRYLHMLNKLPPEIRDNTRLKISDRKKVIREFIRGLSWEKLKPLLSTKLY